MGCDCAFAYLTWGVLQRNNPVCSTAATSNCLAFVSDVNAAFGCCSRFALESAALGISARTGHELPGQGAWDIPWFVEAAAQTGVSSCNVDLQANCDVGTCLCVWLCGCGCGCVWLCDCACGFVCACVASATLTTDTCCAVVRSRRPHHYSHHPAQGHLHCKRRPGWCGRDPVRRRLGGLEEG